MPLTRRYQPTHSPLDTVMLGMDFSDVIPPGAGIKNPGQDFSQTGAGGESVILPTPRLEIWVNWPGDIIPAPEDWSVDPRLAPVTPWGIVDQTATGPQYGVWFWVLDETNPNPDAVEWAQFDFGQTPATEGADIGGVGIGWIALGTAVRGRAVYSIVSGGASGIDYQFRWFVTDTLGNRWTRTANMLVGVTS